MDVFFTASDIKEIGIKAKTSLKFSTEKEIEFIRKMSTTNEDHCLTPTYIKKDWNQGEHMVARSKLDEPTHSIVPKVEESH